MFNNYKISVIIPAKDEEQSISIVIDALNQINYQERRLIDEIIVCDNGSRDLTAQNASLSGAKVVHQTQAGYGIACLTGIREISKNTDIIIFIDADNAFYSEQCLRLVKSIANGNDMVIGSRVLGTAEKHALTFPQQLGNQLASFLINKLWQQRVTDLGPFRAIRKESLIQLNMQDQSFGWTVEMQVKGILQGMSIQEVPVDTRQRIGKSKISGTITGSLSAGIGILSMIARLWWNNRKNIPTPLLSHK